jgi:hypothetical protein
MAATVTRAKVKGETWAKLGELVNGGRTLLLCKDGLTVGYYLRELDVDFGRGFELEKFHTEPATDGDRVYHVHLDAQLGDSCTCPGGSYRGKCKHVDALAAMVAAGKL